MSQLETLIQPLGTPLRSRSPIIQYLWLSDERGVGGVDDAPADVAVDGAVDLAGDVIFDKISSWIFLCYGRFVLLHRKWLESERKKVVFDDVLSYLSCCAFHTCRLPNATQTVPQIFTACRSGSNLTKKRLSSLQLTIYAQHRMPLIS